MCKKIIPYLMHTSIQLQHIGFTLLRISFGIMFLVFGYKKINSGATNLTQLGSAISYFGINYGYLLWGYLAAFTEFFGGIAYILGLWTRIISLPIIWLLIVAIQFHLQQNDPITIWFFPVLCLCIAISFFIAGSGIYSLDYAIQQKK